MFTGDLAYSVRKGIAEIDRAVPGLSWLIVVLTPTRTPRQLLTNQWRNLRRNGWRWIPYQILDVLQRMREPKTARLRCHDSLRNELFAPALEMRPNVRRIFVTDIHSQVSLDTVAAFEPYLGLSLAAPILRRPLFSIPKVGTINLHKGKLPDYRGMPPAFWELWNDEQSIGCTVHWVDEQLDTGAIVRQATIDRALFSTVRGLQLRLDEVGVDLMRDAVRDILSGAAVSTAQAPLGKTFRKPTLAQVTTLKRKLMRDQIRLSSAPKRLIKRTSSTLGHLLWPFGLRRVLRPRITVLLYHRVSDDARDNLTVGIEQFDRQMALLGSHCQPMSIEQVLTSTDIPRAVRPLVAVTFDDGYLDNYLNAAPILMRHGIPAAFFVSTGLIDTDRRFPHDVRRGNAPIPLMKWDHLRKMRDWGFTLGSHSVTHIDCAAEPIDVVRSELVRSRDHLHQELGVSDPIFAYPYGGRHNMTPQRLELVKQAGYSGCLSAYGGTNIATVDRFNVLRRGIHWEYTDDAFLFECLALI